MLTTDSPTPDELFERFWPEALKVVQRYSPQRQFRGLADSLESDARLVLWQLSRGGKLTGEGATGLVHVAVRRRVFTRVKRERKKSKIGTGAFRPQFSPPALGTWHESPSNADTGDPVEQLPCKEPDPGDVAEQRDELEVIRRLLSSCTAEERDLIDRRFFRGETLEEIGQEKRVSRDAIVWRLRKLIAQLRAATGRNPDETVSGATPDTTTGVAA